MRDIGRGIVVAMVVIVTVIVVAEFVASIYICTHAGSGAFDALAEIPTWVKVGIYFHLFG